MALTNMARSKKERKKSRNNEMCSISSDDKFPLGLSIRLDDESLTKLKMTKLPRVGDKVALAAVGRIESVSQRESAGRDKHRDVSIQIEQLDVKNGPAKSAEDAVSDAIKDV